MSIYATWLSFDADDHAEQCDRWVRITRQSPSDQQWNWDRKDTDGSTYELDNTRPCTCGAGPIAYQASHIMPTDANPRAGSVDVAVIPAYVAQARDGHEPEDDEHVLAWLRLSVNEETALLDRAQVIRLYHTLGDWLIHQRPELVPDFMADELSTKEGI